MGSHGEIKYYRIAPNKSLEIDALEQRASQLKR